eukprot:826770-Pelagomonas_calceolata.AAC.2
MVAIPAPFKANCSMVSINYKHPHSYTNTYTVRAHSSQALQRPALLGSKRQLTGHCTRAAPRPAASAPAPVGWRCATAPRTCGKNQTTRPPPCASWTALPVAAAGSMWPSVPAAVDAQRHHSERQVAQRPATQGERKHKGPIRGNRHLKRLSHRGK